MNALKDAVQFSLNEFLGRLRNRMEWKKRLDVYKFSDRCEQIVDELDLNQISYDALHAAIAVENQGASAMNDAICHAIDALGEKLAAMPERERPETVVFAVVTDGRDNASKKFTLADVWKRVTCQSYVFSWKFEYLAMKANELRENCRLDETPIYPAVNDVEEVGPVEENDTVTELESESQAIYDESEDYDPANDAEQAQDSQIVKEPGFSDEGLYDAEDGSPIELESTSTLGNAEVESELEENLAAVSDEISQTDEPNAAETESDGSAAQFEQPPQEATPPDYSAIFFEPQVDLYRHEFRTLQSLSEILAGSDIDEYSTLKNDGATAKDAGAQTENKEEPDGAADQEPEDYDGKTEAPSEEPESNGETRLGACQEEPVDEEDAAPEEGVSNDGIEPDDSEAALEEEAEDDEAVEETDAAPETADGEEYCDHADGEIPEENQEDGSENANPPAEENSEDNQSDGSQNADGKQDAIPEQVAAFTALEPASEEVVKEASEMENRDSISEENAGEDAAYPTGEEEEEEEASQEDVEDEACKTNDGEEDSEEEECDEADVDGTDESEDVGLSEDISGETDEGESEIAEESEEDADEAVEEEESPQETDSDEQEEYESADGYEEIDEEESEIAEESEEDADEAVEEEESPQETDSGEQEEYESAGGYEDADEEESEDGGDLEEDEETDGLEDELQEDYSDETEEEEEVFESVSDEELPEETGELEEETVSAETEETDSEEIVSELSETDGGEEELQDAQNEEANESEPAADEELPREDGETEYAAESDAPEAVNAEVEPTNREEVSPGAAYHSESVRVENGSNVEEIAEPVSDSAPTGEVEDASDARQERSETIPEETAARRPAVAPESTAKSQPEPRPVYSFKLPLSFQGVPETRAERPNENRPQIEQVKGETDHHESIVKDNPIEEDEPVLINPSVDSFTIVPPKLVVPTFDERVETSNAPDKPRETAGAARAAERVAPRQPQKPRAPENAENRVTSAPKKSESESKPESGSITATTADGKKIVLNGSNLNQIKEIMQGNQPEKAPAKESRKAPSQEEPASKPQSQQEEAPYEPPQLVVPPDMPETENDVFKPTSFPLDDSFQRIADGKDSHFTLTVDAPVENRHGSRHKTLPMPGENYKFAEESPKSAEYEHERREDGEGTADAPKTESLFGKIARSLKALFKGPNS
ncbi:MAG: hypothetical protein II807_06440 [Thermoguttaceae bacterium]|nr:hypothetical protein [Thermoguttaceae bacterium]